MKHKNPGASNIFPHKNSNREETKEVWYTEVVRG